MLSSIHNSALFKKIVPKQDAVNNVPSEYMMSCSSSTPQKQHQKQKYL